MRKSGFVAIIGRPNAGKSTLLNKILKSEISIVTPKAQTTRERVIGILNDEEKGQIVFVDTPGIHRAKEGGINAYMIKEVKEAVQGVSCLWYILDPVFAFSSNLKHELAVLELISVVKVPIFVLFNKTDVKPRLTSDQTRTLEEKFLAESKKRNLNLSKFFSISAKTGHNVTDLLNETWSEIEEGPLYYEDTDQLSDRPVKYFVAEKIREQLFFQLGDEIPYSCAVKITSFKEDAKPVRIEATIVVERESQKGMVIGAGGKKIKSIGQHARKNIEAFVNSQIFLGLKVEVLKNWSKDPKSLKNLGYVLPDKKGRG